MRRTLLILLALLVAWRVRKPLSQQQKILWILLLTTMNAAAPAKLQLAHQRIDALVSGATPAGALNLGAAVGNVSRMAIASGFLPGTMGAAGTVAASTLAELVTAVNTKLSGPIQSAIDRVNALINEVGGIEAEAIAHGFSL